MICACGFNRCRDSISVLCQSTCIESSGSSIIMLLSPARSISIRMRNSCFSPDDNAVSLISSLSLVWVSITEMFVSSNFTSLFPLNAALQRHASFQRIRCKQLFENAFRSSRAIVSDLRRRRRWHTKSLPCRVER